jgi:hypothetical protein
MDSPRLRASILFTRYHNISLQGCQYYDDEWLPVSYLNLAQTGFPFYQSARPLALFPYHCETTPQFPAPPQAIVGQLRPPLYQFLIAHATSGGLTGNPSQKGRRTNHDVSAAPRPDGCSTCSISCAAHSRRHNCQLQLGYCY